MGVVDGATHETFGDDPLELLCDPGMFCRKLKAAAPTAMSPRAKHDATHIDIGDYLRIAMMGSRVCLPDLVALFDKDRRLTFLERLFIPNTFQNKASKNDEHAKNVASVMAELRQDCRYHHWRHRLRGSRVAAHREPSEVAPREQSCVEVPSSNGSDAGEEKVVALGTEVEQLRAELVKLREVMDLAFTRVRQELHELDGALHGKLDELRTNTEDMLHCAQLEKSSLGITQRHLGITQPVGLAPDSDPTAAASCAADGGNASNGHADSGYAEEVPPAVEQRFNTLEEKLREVLASCEITVRV
eukprot:NODE_1271_length_1188_cov_287.781112.p1 GENE.NODE_1271_length_1188_cov_287.781112~~NODE_1271_length_1188_cov_287.781112.p1  ORF type:complete len:302 (+),score=95.14 NODE_1271_length_1188_cov_287.781112:3-908(+)